MNFFILKHLATVNKWQVKLENPGNQKRLKRLASASKKKLSSNSANDVNTNDDNEKNKENSKTLGFENIPFDCKIEIMRRLNTGK